MALTAGSGSGLVHAATYNVADDSDLRTALGSAVDGDTIVLTGNITLTDNLPPITRNLTINGGNFALDGANSYRGFFVQQGTVSIRQIDIRHTKAQGGAGANNGGGGMGAGGGLFVNNVATVTLTDVRFDGNAAAGGSAAAGGWDGGGGGGMSGRGGAFAGNVYLPSGGLGGGGGSGSYGGAAQAGAGTGGGAGGTNGGSGGSGTAPFGGGGGGDSGGSGGAGADFGGGGGGGRFCGYGGAGGFGGGGGGGGCAAPTSPGGSGGYGGGGGGQGGSGGFAGGWGGGSSGGTSGGGGGAGLGGAIFVRHGGQLAVQGNFGVQGGSVSGGAGGQGAANGSTGTDGSAWGNGMFLQGNGSIAFAPGAGQTQAMADAMADERGVVGFGGSYALTLSGAGTLVLSGDNRYSGGTTVSAGVLQADTAGPASATGNGMVTVSGGRLVGQGHVAGYVNLNSGSVAPGSTSAPHGTLSVGSFNQTGGSLMIAADAATSSQLMIGSVAALGGTLQMDFASAPAIGQSFTVLSANSGLSGTFAHMDVSGLAAGTQAQVAYGPQSVTVSISRLSYAIATNPSPAGGGTITCTVDPVPHGQDSECSATPASGFTFDAFTGDCVGASCILSNVQSTKTVGARFLPVQSFSGTTVPGDPWRAGPATASFTGGGETCHFDGTNTAFVAAPAAKPVGHTLPQGMFRFRLADCDASPVTMTVEWPGPVSGYIKFGRPGAADTKDSYFVPEGLSINGNSVSFTVQDGQKGDDDWSENGIIVDPTGPTEVRPPMAVPALGPWGVLWLSLAAAGLGGWRRRSRGG